MIPTSLQRSGVLLRFACGWLCGDVEGNASFCRMVELLVSDGNNITIEDKGCP